MSEPSPNTLDLPAGVLRVTEALAALGHAHTPVMLDDAAVLVITSGDLRVDEKKVQAIVCADGGKLGRADADFVKARTGFSIGGVSPLAHTTAPVTLIDDQLFRFDVIWAAAGHPHGVFRLTPDDLLRLTGAPVHDVTALPPAP